MPKTGIFDWFSYELPVKERLRLIKEIGFEAIALWWEGEARFSALNEARSLGLEIDSIHIPFKNPDNLWTAGDEGENYLALLASGLNDCADRGMPTAVAHISGFRTTPAPTQTGLDRIKRLTDLAERRGVNLAFENLNRLDTLDFIFDNIDSERVGFCFDSGHEHFNHKGEDCLERYGSRLFSLHLHDNFGDDDTHLLPFDGSIDWEEIKRRLSKWRPLGIWTLEVDFNRKHEKGLAYQALSAQEYLNLAYERALRLINL